MSPEPRTQAIGIIQDALKSARQEGEQGDWIDDGTEAAELVDAMLAAGWVPPEEAETLRRDFAALKLAAETARVVREARIGVLESSWVPPERVETIAALVRQLGAALEAHGHTTFDAACGNALRAYRDAAGSGKLQIVTKP